MSENAPSPAPAGEGEAGRRRRRRRRRRKGPATGAVAGTAPGSEGGSPAASPAERPVTQGGGGRGPRPPGGGRGPQGRNAGGPGRSSLPPGIPGGKKKRRRKKGRAGGGRERGPLIRENLPKDDILYRPGRPPLNEARRAEIRKKYQLEDLARLARERTRIDDFKEVYEKMGFLETEVQKKVANADCPICKQPIVDYYATLHFENGDDLAHVSCIAADLKRKHEVQPGEDVVYLGNGAFGIVKMREADGVPEKTPPRVAPKSESASPEVPLDREERRRRLKEEKAALAREMANADVRERSGIEIRKKIQYENRKLSMKQQRTQIKN